MHVFNVSRLLRYTGVDRSMPFQRHAAKPGRRFASAHTL